MKKRRRGRRRRNRARARKSNSFLARVFDLKLSLLVLLLMSLLMLVLVLLLLLRTGRELATLEERCNCVPLSLFLFLLPSLLFSLILSLSRSSQCARLRLPSPDDSPSLQRVISLTFRLSSWRFAPFHTPVPFDDLSLPPALFFFPLFLRTSGSTLNYLL